MPRGNERLPDDDRRNDGPFYLSKDGIKRIPPFYLDPLTAWEAQQRYDASIAPARSFYDQEPKPKIFDQWDAWELSLWGIKP
jgi:hypothetical protein